MESRVEKAVELHKSGCNCAQAVFVSYADIFGISREQAMQLTTPFGGGLAGMRYMCGTVNAMAMIAGLHGGVTSPDDKARKKDNVDMVRMMADEFRAANGSLICAQLRGFEPGLPDGVTPKPCSEYVRTSALLIEKYLLTKQIGNSK